MSPDTIHFLADLLGAINICISAVISFVLWGLRRQSMKVERMEDHLRAAAAEAVDLRFASLSAEHQATMTQMKLVVGEMQKRLDRGDHQFDSQYDAWHKLELRTQKQLADLREQCASKEDVRRIWNKLESMQTAMVELATAARKENP